MALEDLEDLADDIQKQIARASKSTHLTTKDELKNNVYPLLAQLTEQVAEIAEALEEGVSVDDELIDKMRATLLLAETALGKVCEELGGEEKLSDFTREHVKAFRMASTEMLTTIAEMEVEGEEEEEEEVVAEAPVSDVVDVNATESVEETK